MIGDASCTKHGFIPATTSSPITTCPTANEAAARTARRATTATTEVPHDPCSDRTGGPDPSFYTSYTSSSWFSSFLCCCVKPLQATHAFLKVLFWKPVRNILQRWRLSLASLLFFTIFLTDNFGLSTSIHVDLKTRSSRSVPPHNHESPNTEFHNNNRHRHHSPSSSYWQNNYGSHSTYWNPSEFFYCNVVNVTVNNSTGIHTDSSSPSSSSSSCLVSYNIGRDVCKKTVGHRVEYLRGLKLEFCGAGYYLYNLIDLSDKMQSKIDLGPESECRGYFDPIEQLEHDVRVMYSHFEEILAKADCLTNYSTHWNCSDCKVSQYKSLFYCIILTSKCGT